MTTKAERDYMGKVAALPCCACGAAPPSLVHHIRFEQGMGQRASNYLVLSLCPECHVGPFSIHKTKQQFQAVYGSELSLLSKVIEALQNE